MDLDKLLDSAPLKKIVARAKKESGAKQFSDIIDDQGNQYVDLVMEGGGMLGIALVGYIYVLEQLNIRFLGLGGASAGSINALLLAALGVPAEAKGSKLLHLIDSKNFYDFVDGDEDAKEFIRNWREGAGKFKLAIKALQVVDNLRDDLGLNPGTAFERWIEDLLRAEGIVSSTQLNARMNTLPQGLRTRAGDLLTSETISARLAIIAADISTETKVEFPRMAPLYWRDPGDVNPAIFVRASMAIPFFFQPLRVKPLPRGPQMENLWRELAGYSIKNEGGIPADALFVDGGIMSNFPIDVFHDYGKVPRAPTFGVKLELDRRRKQIDGPIALLLAMFNSARHTLDYDFLHHNPDYCKLVTWIPAKGYDWLDFSMSDQDKAGLFLEGANCAAEFLRQFDWDCYKNIRKGMMDANSAAR